MSTLRIGLLFLVMFVVALLWQAPATVLAARINAESKGTVELRDVSGTIWSGTGTVHLPRQALTLDVVTWRFQPQALFGLEWRYALSVDDTDLSGKLLAGATLTSVVLQEAELRLPARTVSALFPQLTTFAPEGMAAANIRKLSCAATVCDGDLNLTWERAAFSLAELRPLGDYQLAAAFKAGRADYELKTLKGTVRAAGRGAWEPGKRPTFAGEVSAPPEQLPKVQGLLRLLGNPDERGVVRINR